MNACARLPAHALPRLARWRDRDDVRVVVRGDALWVFWPAAAAAVASHVRALPGAEPADWREGSWRRVGESLPLFDVPDPSDGVTLDRVIFPEAMHFRSSGVPPEIRSEETGESPVPRKSPVSLVRDDSPRRATALRVTLGVLSAWADAAPSDDIEAVEAAISDETALLRGRLPALVGERYWGRRLLVAAGWRPEPALAENVLAEALGLGDDFALFAPEGVEVVPASAFGPLTRAGVRLAAGGAA